MDYDMIQPYEFTHIKKVNFLLLVKPSFILKNEVSVMKKKMDKRSEKINNLIKTLKTNSRKLIAIKSTDMFKKLQYQQKKSGKIL